MKEELKTENELLKKELAELKDAKGKIEEELLLEKRRSAVYVGRRGFESLIKEEIAKQKFLTTSEIGAQYDLLKKALLDIAAKYLCDE
ncbi:hypothetical protein TSUD_48820 [Trifolium subterraneum]|uniref:Uncharacterized protein n=1 Tax=Trifolium subterraneum TaxID=3900 RepID=A0A2Z6LX10_TRISU|nr:hypothetical protein TSUD_48820 [Trifolium subterraneum]